MVFAGCGDDASSDSDGAVKAAMTAYDSAAAGGRDLGSGPCIAENLPGYPDWVVDIAHEPRDPVDDDPANQCQRFVNGEAHHFVELTPDGELIRAQ